jgi:RNA-directed DNA polymerase
MQRRKLLNQSDDELRQQFRALRSPRDVADLLQVSYQRLAYHLRTGSSGQYTRFTIPKSDGSLRIITAPAPGLKNIQRRLNEVLQAVYEIKVPAHGFAKGKSVVTNARLHRRRRWIFNIDLVDFFHSIHFGRVRGLLMSRPYYLPLDAATTLARVCCYESRLPQGAPTSPVVSNMICASLDRQLLRLAQTFSCRYTRYADDLTFSTRSKHFPEQLAMFQEYPAEPQVLVGRRLQNLIEKNGFTVKLAKVRLRYRSRRQEVTGITVNQVCNLPKSYYRQLRAMLHAWEKYGYQAANREFLDKYQEKHRNPGSLAPSLRRVLAGKLEFLRMVRGAESNAYHRLIDQFRRLRGQAPHHALWVVETEAAGKTAGYQGTAFALQGFGLITCDHVVAEAESITCYQVDDSGVEQKRFQARVEWKHEESDLAILRIGTEPDRFLSPGRSERIRRGVSVKLMGFPNHGPGRNHTESLGLVTSVGRRIGFRRFFVNVPIFSGNSGGPLLNIYDAVVGIAVTGWKANGERTNDEFAVIALEALEHLRPPPTQR